jgi:hypothetical protein
MKKFRMIVSAAVVFAVVGGALAFKPLNQGSIFCFANSDIPNVKSGFSCNDLSQQPTSTKIDFAVSANSSDPTDNPCLTAQTPFNGAVSGACTQTAPGTTHYIETQQ